MPGAVAEGRGEDGSFKQNAPHPNPVPLPLSLRERVGLSRPSPDHPQSQVRLL